ncbi:MAG: hypothetical protein ACKVT0_08185 [Planctomycetaceae bacterium]
MRTESTLSRRTLSLALCCGFATFFLGTVEHRAVQAQEEVQSVQLQAIGGLIAGYAHATYAMVGTTADGYANKVYDAEKVKALMDEMRGMQVNIIRILRRLQGSALTKEDDEFIDEAINIFKLIGKESELLVKFAETNEKEVAEEFDKVRVSIGERMSALFGQSAGDATPAEKTETTDDAKDGDGDEKESEKDAEKSKDDEGDDKSASDDDDDEAESKDKKPSSGKTDKSAEEDVDEEN